MRHDPAGLKAGLKLPLVGRRSLLKAAVIGAPFIGSCTSLALADDGAPVARSAQGLLRGMRQNGVVQFRGIPYGGSVSGAENRFKAPPPPPQWTGIRDATRFAAPSPQPPGSVFGDNAVPDEDCLVLNVWTPALDGVKRPVMVYQHGGGFVIGSGSAPWQEPSALVRENDVVVVQSNHRLGLMGYLYLGQLLGPEYQGNQGLLDLLASLKWVNENIAEFGGDPDNVTIFGESGGGGKTTALYGMPSADPYFHKASIESSIGPGDSTPEMATEVARELMRRVGASRPEDLLTTPVDQLMAAQAGNIPPAAPGVVQTDLPEEALPGLPVWPFIDGEILPTEPFGNGAPDVSAAKPLINGTCKDEAVFFYSSDPSAFSLDEEGLCERLQPMTGDRTQAWIDTFRRSRPDASPSELFMAITTARPWRAQATKIADAKAAQGQAPVYSYILDYNSPELVPGTDYPEGSPHASDIGMKFNNVTMMGPQHPERLATGRNMSRMWATFARTGRPGAEGQPEWNPYTLENRETMIIDAECRLENDPERIEREFYSAEPGAASLEGA